MANIFNIIRALEKAGYKAKAEIVEKNGINKTGIKVKVDDKINLIFYPSDYCMQDNEIVNHIIESLNNNPKDNDIINSFLNMSLPNVKDNLVLCIQPYVNTNKYITRNYLNLQIYVRLLIDKNGTSAKVNKSMINAWEMSEDELFEIARENVKNKLTIYPMGMALSMIGEFNNDLESFTYPLVLSTKNYAYGSGALLIKEKLNDISKVLNCDLYILPSSIHECLIVPENLVDDVADLKYMVLEVNETEVSEEDFLSNNVYKYSKDMNLLYLVM